MVLLLAGPHCCSSVGGSSYFPQADNKTAPPPSLVGTMTTPLEYDLSCRRWYFQEVLDVGKNQR